MHQNRKSRDNIPTHIYPPIIPQPANQKGTYFLTLGAELAPFNIRVVGYAPGGIKTGMTEQLIQAKGKKLQSQIALQQLGDVEDIARVVLFLASDFAAYISGTCIEILVTNHRCTK
jgi:NAD(P)-dependent dehydrogenase (short-subunit alcohol dehydrogenase family)